MRLLILYHAGICKVQLRVTLYMLACMRLPAASRRHGQGNAAWRQAGSVQSENQGPTPGWRQDGCVGNTVTPQTSAYRSECSSRPRGDCAGRWCRALPATPAVQHARQHVTQFISLASICSFNHGSCMQPGWPDYCCCCCSSTGYLNRQLHDRVLSADISNTMLCPYRTHRSLLGGLFLAVLTSWMAPQCWTSSPTCLSVTEC